MNNKYNMMFYQPVIGLEIHCELKTERQDVLRLPE